ncbi:MAG TPA: LCP family protein [Candidatus Saccharimonadales bacterium]|nr:LCP family protein [Candidatus Saccharimonadales bacterium]
MLKKRPLSDQNSSLPYRPARPIKGPSKQSADFPTLGMTLPSYKHDSFKAKLPIEPSKQANLMNRLRSLLTLKRFVISLALILLIALGWVGWKFVYNQHKLFGGGLFGLLSSTKLKGEDDGRVNILLAGYSADDPWHAGASLTDSIMIISIDTKANRAFMLSIPRDLWVKIPGRSYQKINAVYNYGQADKFNASGYPAGGMGQLEQIIEQNLGLNINYYALINYNALRQAVDAVGGVDVNIQSSDPRGLYDPNIDYSTNGPLVKLSNGKHHLDGQQALNLARARGDAYNSYGFPMSDFDRTDHQRQLLLALKSKAVSAGVLANPLKLGQLFDAIGNNVKTDFTSSEVRRLYDVTKAINGTSVQSFGLNNINNQTLLMGYQTPRGDDALIPVAGVDDYSQIQLALRRLTSNNPVVKEQATVVVLNGTNIYGLAAKGKKLLEAKYVSVIQTGDAQTSQQATTLIIDNSHGQKSATRQLLLAQYGDHFTTSNPYTQTYSADFIIVLGSDQATN